MSSVLETVPETVAATSSRDLSWFSALGLSEYVAIDLETTGLDARRDSTIEIGAVRFRDGIEHDSFRTFLGIEGTLHPFITNLTGITDSDLQDAPAFEEVAKKFFDFLGPAPLVGQNIDFDLGFISTAVRKLDSFDIAYDVHRVAVVDTCSLARTFWPDLHRYNLGALAGEFGIPLAAAHRAEEDARATGLLLATMIERLPKRVWGTLTAEIHRLVSNTTHRSRFFFRGLANVSANIAKPTIATESNASRTSSEPPSYDIEKTLGAGGMFEKVLPSFRSRPMQIQMAENVATALHDSSIALIEAPTGTGKSLAYLIPALEWASQNEQESRQVIISSHTRALQEQLYQKDIREIELATGSPVPAAILKGRNNYLCRRRFRQLLNEATDRLSELECMRLLPLLRWAELTTTGDVSEIPGFDTSNESYLWSLVCSDAQACAGPACGSPKGDFHRMAQEKAAASRLIFVNHALLMSDPSRFLAGEAPNRKLVIDEAHQFERAAVSAMTIELSLHVTRNVLLRLVDERGSRGLLPRLEAAMRSVNSSDANRAAEVTDSARKLYAVVRSTFSALSEAVQPWQNDNSRLSKIRFRATDSLHSAIRLAIEQLHVTWPQLTAELGLLLQDLLQLKGEDRISAELLLELRSASDMLSDIETEISAFYTLEDEDRVYWVESGFSQSGSGCSLYSSPIAINEMLEKGFWPRVDSAILTSATLTAQNSFNHFIETMGLEEFGPERLFSQSLKTPFELEKQARVLIPTYLSDPKQREHLEDVSRLLIRLAESVRRGTLVLCTSLDSVKQITAALEPVCRREGRLLLTQKSAVSVPELLARFKKERNAILVGSSSFWEGIDVVGEALQILVIVKLPFDVPTDPWIEARGEYLARRGKDPFRDFSVPEATLRLKQGLGRLIRHMDDRGVAIIADPRIERSQFGRSIRSSLQTVPRSVGSEDALIQQISEFFALESK